MATRSSAGVLEGSTDVSDASYCTYRELPPMAPPEDAIAVNAVHDASGAGVLPVRIAIASAVLDGVVAVHESAPQFTVSAPSKTRDVKVPAAANGSMRSQSIVTPPPPVEKSLTRGRIGCASAIACVATTAPSIEYTTEAGAQSIRKRCGDPR